MFIIIRGSKLFTIHPNIGEFLLNYLIIESGYLTEITMDQLIEEEFKGKFWVHLNHQS